MKLLCKCGNQVTTGLYPTKKWEFDKEAYHGGQYFITKGSFIELKSYAWDGRHSLAVNPSNIINCYVPEFKIGNGCCNNWGIPFYCGGCGESLGWQSLDCHCNVYFEISTKKVNRSYK